MSRCLNPGPGSKHSPEWPVTYQSLLGPDKVSPRKDSGLELKQRTALKWQGNVRDHKMMRDSVQGEKIKGSKPQRGGKECFPEALLLHSWARVRSLQELQG